MTSSSRRPKVRIQQLSKAFQTNGHVVGVLDDVTLDVAEGEFVCILGPSGCGKSTLLRCLNGLETPTSGQVQVCGVVLSNPKADLNTLRQRVGMVFQRFHLFPHLTALGNVALGPRRVLDLPPAEADFVR